MDGRDNTERISFSFEEESFLSKCFTFVRRAGGGQNCKIIPFSLHLFWLF